MPRAELYYYPTGLGHTCVNVIFSKEEVPDKKDYLILIYSKHNPSTRWEEEAKSEARRCYRPIVFLDEHGTYSIYGYKNGSWQETPLDKLSTEETAHLRALPFGKIFTKNNGEYFICSYENDSWQKISCSKDFRGYSFESSQRKSIKPSSPLYKLIQNGHPEFKRTEYFFDWGGSYDFEKNEKYRGKPIRIDLPPTEKKYIQFFTEVENAEHTTNEPSPLLSYDLFSYSCAHVSLEILYYAGYTLKKPSNRFALLPITVAMNACDLAHKARSTFRKQLMESVSTTATTQQVNELIKLSMNRLKDTINFNLGSYIGNCSKELEQLSKLNYDGSVKSIEQLLKISEESSHYLTQELTECIALLDPKECFNAGISRLECIASSSKSVNDTVQLQEIAANLRCELSSFNKHDISHEQFIQNCSLLIDKATPIFEKEANFPLVILKNIALALCGLVVFYLVAAFINQSNSGNFLFFKEPHLSKTCENIQNCVLKIGDPEINKTA